MPLKTFREKTRQMLHLDAKFKVAASPRVEQMYKELSAFAVRLKSSEKQVTILKKATMGMLHVTEETLTAPLPKVYTTHTQTGKLLVEDTHDLSSQDDAVQITQLGRISEATARRLDQEVLLPMDKWQKGFADVRKRKALLEEFRVKYDAEKRAMAKLESQKLKLEQNNGQLDNKALRKYESKAVKYHAAEQAWVEYEQATADALARLVADAKLIRMHLTRAMQVEGQVFQDAVALPAVQEAVQLAQQGPPVVEVGAGAPGSALATPEGSVKSYTMTNKPLTPDHVEAPQPMSDASPGVHPGTPAPGTPTKDRYHAGSAEHIKIPPSFEAPAEEDDLPTPPTSHYPAVPTGHKMPAGQPAMEAY